MSFFFILFSLNTNRTKLVLSQKLKCKGSKEKKHIYVENPPVENSKNKCIQII